MGSSSDSDSSYGGRGSKHWRSREEKQYYREQRRMDKMAAKEQKIVNKHARKEAKLVAKEQRIIGKHARKMEAKFGRVMLASAVGGGLMQDGVTGEDIPMAVVISEPARPSSRLITVIRSHDVDERRPEYLAHGIIRVIQGEVVELLDGSIQTGLPPPYEEYVLIRTATHRVGKVGKLCFY